MLLELTRLNTAPNERLCCHGKLSTSFASGRLMEALVPLRTSLAQSLLSVTSLTEANGLIAHLGTPGARLERVMRQLSASRL